MDLLGELREAGKAVETETFRSDFLGAVRMRLSEAMDPDELDYAFVCEFAARLSDAEEFQDFIPCHAADTGYRGKKFRVDGYELDDADESIRLLVADFRGGDESETLTRTRAESIFAQLKTFVEESATGRIWTSAGDDSAQTRELSGIIEQKHQPKEDGSRSVSRYRLYLITDSVLSDRLKELPSEDLDGIPLEFHIWDIGRLRNVSTSILGTEELDIDFTHYVPGGLHCLKAGETADYEGYLCVVPGEALAELYDRYGSRLLEGNVRAFLNTTPKANRGIQATIRKEPERFFVYNNGISATATSAKVEPTEDGTRLLSARYLQIVNGGQTTASLHIAMRKDKADLSQIAVQMKLSVVKAKDSDMLDDMIQNIAKYSNTQNKVNEADFFSNHPFHRAIERRSRSVKAPAVEGAQFNTYWFYERARGQYLNEQSKMTLAQKKTFQREHPRSQLVTKTDLAKFENSWRKLPHIVSRHSQKNFLNFAEYIGKEYGADGRKFDNDVFFREAVARAILFKFIERMVSQAKDTWYSGDYRAQIVTYTMAKLVDMIEQQARGMALNLKGVWTKQAISPALATQLEALARGVSSAITAPPVSQMNVGEWCKKEECWDKVRNLKVTLTNDLRSELISAEEAASDHTDGEAQGTEDVMINSVMEVVRLSESGCWSRLNDWSRKFSPLYGVEADLVRSASRRGWVPSDRQAAKLIKVLRRLEQAGFRAG
jgi:hypothetical protein